MGRKNYRHSAFTLIELLLVITILGVVVSIGVSYTTNQVYKGNDANRKGALNRIAVAFEEYEKDTNCYPLASSNPLACSPGTGLTPYLAKVPCDPVTQNPYSYEPGVPATCPSWYRIYAILQNSSDTSAVESIGSGGAYNYYIGSANAPKPTPIP